MILISCKISSSVSAAVITIPALSSLSHTSSCHGKDGAGGAGGGRGGGGVGLSSEKVRNVCIYNIYPTSTSAPPTVRCVREKNSW